MSARSLYKIVGGKASKGHRTGQPVRRSSFRAGEREPRYWRPFNKAERNARMRAAETYDQKHKIAGKRNGPLGAIGVDVLRELMRMIDFKTGRLEPAIATLATRLSRSRGAIVKALARLKDHGFLNWIRRFEPIKDPDTFGPQVKQVTNAYWFGLPKEAADMVRRMMGKGPMPDDEVTRRKANEEETAAMLATISAEDLAAFRAGDESPLAKALASLGRRVDLCNANSPGGQNPTLQG
ncbi:hypothetical protein C8J46_105317 [Sphingomonas sp. PP-F2F-A104-K0414]|uniref:replication protein A n=1 Tax=Sphingomonas sp. PP-F2F-A104-K0414 TaxID=2135661 RepID=UPI0010DBA67C|nr:replication protein A [Sphingomonas sp. PP-F2F-A104-K0414]TCP98164.1 hypothetical protein C8J46_105317 [Sphingomonas sp. PP-F2F-A104-K0414]